jgi:DNA-binding transcriptional regulator PaaX
VLELTELLATTQQNVSKHLGVLQRAGIVARRKQGNFAYYRIIDEGVYALCEQVCGVWGAQTRFDLRFAAFVCLSSGGDRVLRCDDLMWPGPLLGPGSWRIPAVVVVWV